MLIHKKTPAAFKQNIRTEVHAGKPVKQAVAIAYSEKRRAEHKKAHGGAIEDCPHCYADGGDVKGGKVNLEDHEEEDERSKVTGTTENYSTKGKQTPIGKMQREEDLKKYKKMPGPKLQGLYSGGAAKASVAKAFQDSGSAGAEEYDPNSATYSKPQSPYADTSHAGPSPDPNSGRDLDQEKSDNWANEAKGGEIEGDDGEIHEMLGQEMMDAIHKKDHKRIMDGIEACVLSCMNKHKD